MSLFSSIQLASNSLIASQIGLQVTGNNIANANTPGYIRQEVVLTPSPSQRKGSLILGLGVEVNAIIQKSDLFLEERLRGSESDLANSETKEETYSQLEAIVGELSSTDLSTTLNEFFGSISDVLNQPESVAVRNLAILKGETVASDVTRLASRVRDIHKDVDGRIAEASTDINRLLEGISKLNVQVVVAEGGGTSDSDAVGLRDKRKVALLELSRLIDIRSVEQSTGSVTVFAGGEYLVFEGTYRPVAVEEATVDGLANSTIVVEATGAQLTSTRGEVAGLISSRDDILGGVLTNLDDFASTLTYEFNKVFSSGQGLKGHDELTSEFTVNDTTLALDQAGLNYSPVNGSFQVQVFNTQTNLTETTDVIVNLNGLDDDMTLSDLQATLDSIDGITATITPSRGLTIESDSPNGEFSFASDTSGVLAALGINTFFTGISATDMGVNQIVKDDPAKFNASQSGVGGDTANAELMASFIDQPLETQNNSTLAVLYDDFTSDVTQGAAVSKAVTEGFRVFQQTLEGQFLAISGVSIDEEAVNMITYQRAYQASARYISTISDLLDVLVNL